MTSDSPPPDARRAFERELRRGSIELAVLHLLREGEAYGYEIVTTLMERTHGQLDITDGTLYPVLYRLEKAGYLAIRWETQDRGVPRKYYRLTKAGEKELARLTDIWLTFTSAITQLLRSRSEENRQHEQ